MRLISWRSLGKEEEGHVRERSYNDELLSKAKHCEN